VAAVPEGLEGLRIYQLAEELADAVWDEVLRWSPFRGIRSVNSSSMPPTQSGETLRRGTADTITR